MDGGERNSEAIVHRAMISIPGGSFRMGSDRREEWLRGRDPVLLSDVQAIVHDCLRYRANPTHDVNADEISRIR